MIQPFKKKTKDLAMKIRSAIGLFWIFTIGIINGTTQGENCEYTNVHYHEKGLYSLSIEGTRLCDNVILIVGYSYEKREYFGCSINCHCCDNIPVKSIEKAEAKQIFKKLFSILQLQ